MCGGQAASRAREAAGKSQCRAVGHTFQQRRQRDQRITGAVALEIPAALIDESAPASPIADAAQGKYVPLPLNLGPAGEEIVLVLFGTGMRSRSALSAVTASIGGAPAQVDYAGPQGDFAGLDQLNVHVPRSLIGRGDVDLVLMVDGLPANTMKLNVR